MNKEKGGAGFLWAIVAAGLGMATALYGARVWWVHSVDEDAYISLRYARNFLNGDGLVFNPGGEPVEGITNLLWTLTLAVISWTSGLQLPTVALALGVLCGALVLVVAYHWCYAALASFGASRLEAVLISLAAPLLIAVMPGFAFYASSGLETPGFVLLTLAGLYTLSGTGSSKRYAVGSLLLGLAALTRPEGMLVLAVGVFACALRFERGWWRRVLAAALPGFAVLAAATLWRLWYYGSPVPNTFFVRAKGIEVVQQWGLPYLIEAAQNTWFPLAYALILAGALLSKDFMTRNLSTLALVPAWCAYVAYAGGDYMPAHRLIVPILPLVWVLAVPALYLIYRKLSGLLGYPSWRAAPAAFGFPALAFAAFVVLQTPDHLKAEKRHQAANDGWTEYRRSVAEALNARSNPDTLVAANAVGAFGYYSEARIVDMLGLNDGHIARHGTKIPHALPGHQAGDGEYVISREPDYIIPFGIKPEYDVDRTAPYHLSDRQLFRQPEFQENYEPIRFQLDNDLEPEQARSVSMFRHKDLAE